jgi:hypothetical protein
MNLAKREQKKENFWNVASPRHNPPYPRRGPLPPSDPLPPALPFFLPRHPSPSLSPTALPAPPSASCPSSPLRSLPLGLVDKSCSEVRCGGSCSGKDNGLMSLWWWDPDRRGLLSLRRWDPHPWQCAAASSPTGVKVQAGAASSPSDSEIHSRPPSPSSGEIHGRHDGLSLWLRDPWRAHQPLPQAARSTTHGCDLDVGFSLSLSPPSLSLGVRGGSMWRKPGGDVGSPGGGGGGGGGGGPC